MSNTIEYWRLQKAAGLNNREAADYLGLNISTIKRYRNGEKQAPAAVLIALQARIDKNGKS